MEEIITDYLKQIIGYYIMNNKKTDAEFIKSIYNVLDYKNNFKFDLKFEDKNFYTDQINSAALCDYKNKKIYFFNENFSKFIEYAKKNINCSDNFNLFLSAETIIHEYEHIKQLLGNNDAYHKYVYNAIQLFKKAPGRENIYMAKHDEFIAEKKANFVARNIITNLTEYQNEDEKIYFYKAAIDCLTKGYKFNNRKMTSAVENNFKILGFEFDTSKYDYSKYSLTEKMSSGMPIDVNEYIDTMDAYIYPTDEKIKKIKRK